MLSYAAVVMGVAHGMAACGEQQPARISRWGSAPVGATTLATRSPEHSNPTLTAGSPTPEVYHETGVYEQFILRYQDSQIAEHADGDMRWFRLPIEGVEVDVFVVKMTGNMELVPLTVWDTVPQNLENGQRTWGTNGTESIPSYATTRRLNSDVQGILGFVMTGDYSSEDGRPNPPEGCRKYRNDVAPNPQRLCLIVREFENGTRQYEMKDNVIYEELIDTQVKAALGLGPYVVREVNGDVKVEVYFSSTMNFASREHIFATLMSGRPNSVIGFFEEGGQQYLVAMQSFGGASALQMARFAVHNLGVRQMASTDSGSQTGFGWVNKDGSVHPLSRYQDPMSSAIGVYYR